MLKNRFFALSLLLSVSSFVRPEECQPCVTSSECVTTCTENNAEALAYQLTISTEIENNNPENWATYTAAVNNVIELSKTEPHANLASALQELRQIADNNKMNGTLIINLSSEATNDLTTSIVSQEDMMNAKTIKITYRVKTACTECPIWKNLAETTASTVNILNADNESECKKEECINTLLATLSQASTTLDAQISFETKNQ